VLASNRELLIVPQGVLALIPFGVLPFGVNQEPLGSQIGVRYAPSVATAIAAEARPIRQAAALVVGNPIMPSVAAVDGRSFQLGSLPGAEVEAKEVAAELKTKPVELADATETSIRSRLPEAAIVHLATHGYAYASEGEARHSFVALAPDSANDGLLTVGEILEDTRVRLAADLVALSACQTGLGDLRQAEGTIGLQRAFLAKGARSVLVSLWNVSDEATRALMTAFYRSWLGPDRPSKPEALRRAQNEVRLTPGFEHPRYWAAFQLVGAR
jgi:CHAT domain-containing protein